MPPQVILPRLPVAAVPSVFSRNFSHVLVHSLKQADNMLHPMAKRVMVGRGGGAGGHAGCAAGCTRWLGVSAVGRGWGVLCVYAVGRGRGVCCVRAVGLGEARRAWVRLGGPGVEVLGQGWAGVVRCVQAGGLGFPGESPAYWLLWWEARYHDGLGLPRTHLANPMHAGARERLPGEVPRRIRQAGRVSRAPAPGGPGL